MSDDILLIACPAVLGELAEIAVRVIPGAGLAVERVGRSAHDSATPQFVSSPGYEHAWLNPDNTEVSIEDLLSAPAVKLLIRKSGARSADMAAVLVKPALEVVERVDGDDLDTRHG